MSGFLRFCTGVGILILAGIGALVAVSAVGLLALIVFGVNPFPAEH